ncbi:MAG TPA: hypothetical protein VNQ76_06000, partial [Planctomicrobium sp.]|nr:hypothetical protein [Planctomicrobium sp.]
MATLTDYKGLNIVENATGDGGVALTENFITLANRTPFHSTINPSSGNDSDQGFASGDRWMNTSTETMWICLSATVEAAEWKSLFTRTTEALNLIPQESGDTVYIAGGLHVNGLTELDGNLSIQSNTIEGSQISINNVNSSGRSDLFLMEDGIIKGGVQWRGSENSSMPNCIRLLTQPGTNGDLILGTNGTPRLTIGGGTNAASGAILLNGTLSASSTVYLSDGSAGFPALAFASAPSNGFFKTGESSWFLNTGFQAHAMAVTHTGTVSLPVIRYSVDSDTGIYFPAANTLGFVTGGAERMRCSTAGLDVTGDTFRLRNARTPASASATGNQGDTCWDDDYVYV